MSDVASTVETYLAMWNEEDAARRDELVGRAFAAGASYADPALEAEGHAAIGAMVAALQERFPGQRFRRTSGIDMHHDQARFGWELAAPDGVVTVAGIDVATLAPDGRFTRVTGFFGELPAVEAAAA